MSKRLISIAFPSYSNFTISVHLQETKVYIEITKLPNLFLIWYMGFGAYIYMHGISMEEAQKLRAYGLRSWCYFHYIVIIDVKHNLN